MNGSLDPVLRQQQHQVDYRTDHDNADTGGYIGIVRNSQSDGAEEKTDQYGETDHPADGFAKQFRNRYGDGHQGDGQYDPHDLDQYDNPYGYHNINHPLQQPDMYATGSNSDLHELLAITAPRPFLLSLAKGNYLDESWPFINTAKEVYDLYGKANHLGYYYDREEPPVSSRAIPLMRDWFEQFLGEEQTVKTKD